MNNIAIVNLTCLAAVLFSVQHYTDHWCIAIGVVAGLIYLK